MSMRQALIKAREYIAYDLSETIENSSIDHTRATLDDDALPWVKAADELLASIDAALSADPTDAECTAALEVWFSDFSDVTRRQMSTHCTLVNRMRRALIAARNAEHVA